MDAFQKSLMHQLLEDPTSVLTQEQQTAFVEEITWYVSDDSTKNRHLLYAKIAQSQLERSSSVQVFMHMLK